MTETLTESFCERCGTRYTFETARPRRSRLGRAKILSKGLRNYVLSDDSLSEAMADARGEEQLQATVLQLDAFHKTFNFCLDCRQYTCGNCWNAEDGRCLSCAPRPEAVAAEQLEPVPSDAVAGRLAALTAPPSEPSVQSHTIGIAAWPSIDLPRAPEPESAGAEAAADAPAGALAGALADAPAQAGAEGAPEAADEAAGAETSRGLATDVSPDAQLMSVAAPEETEDGAAVAEAEPVAEPVAEGVGLNGLRGLSPGQSLEDAIAAYEASLAPVEPALEPEAEAVAAEPEPVAEPEAVALEPEAEAVAAEPEAVAVAEPEPVAQPQAEAVLPPAPPVLLPGPPPVVDRIAATAAPGAGVGTRPPSWLTVAPVDVPVPAWPESATPSPGGRTIGGRKVVPSDRAAAVWAASAREVMQAGPLGAAAPSSDKAPAPTAQPCVSCGLPLSASARFCRRCGSRQG